MVNNPSQPLRNNPIDQQLNPTLTQPEKQFFLSSVSAKKKFILPVVVLLIALAVGSYFFINNRQIIPANSKLPAQQTTPNSSITVNPNSLEHLLVYTEQEIFEYAPGKQGVRDKSLILYNPTNQQKQVLLSDTSKQFSYSASQISSDKTKVIVGVSNRDTGVTRVFTDPKQEILDINTKSLQPLNLPDVLSKASYTTDLTDNNIYFIYEEAKNIVIGSYDQRSNKVSEIVRVPESKINNFPDSRDFSFSPDKTKFLFAIFGMDIPANFSMIDLLSGNVEQLSNQEDDSSPKWLDNNHIIFQRRDKNGNDSVWVINTVTKKEQMLLGQTEGIDSNTVFRYTFALNGTKIIYPSILHQPGQDISILDIPSKQITTLFHLQANDFTNAQVTSDYKYLVFSSLNNSRISGKSIYLYDLQSKSLSKVCEDQCGDFIIH